MGNFTDTGMDSKPNGVVWVHPYSIATYIVILHEYVMHLMMDACVPLYNSDITVLKDHANSIRRYRLQLFH